MIKVDYTVPIRRGPTEVYDYVTDVERIPEWQHVAGVRKVTKHDPGPLHVGSRFTMERTSRGNVASIDATVTALEPSRRFDFHTIDNDGFVGDFSTTLTPGDGSHRPALVGPHGASRGDVSPAPTDDRARDPQVG